MLKNRIIPCLDVKNGRVVKGINFVDLKDAGDPVEQAKIYSDGGADEICFLDITASNENRETIHDVVEKTSKKSVKSSYSKKKKIKKNILNGIAYVQSTFNNTIISIADTNGNVISWASAGQKGFKGSRKSTPYAAQIAADAAASKALEFGMKTLSVEVKGPGSGRETALRALQARGFRILSIKDTTPMPHNGTRPPKKRRV